MNHCCGDCFYYVAFYHRCRLLNITIRLEAEPCSSWTDPDSE